MNIEYFVFSGTGNTELAAREVGAALAEKGHHVNFHKMEDGAPERIDSNSVVGLAFPIAFCSTYPIALDFISNLPQGVGQRIFMTATMAGTALGAEAKFKSLVSRKGYTPAASAIFIMPSNYNNTVMPVKKNEAMVSAACEQARIFAAALADGSAKWSRGLPIVASFGHWFIRSGKALRLFYRMFPIEIDHSRCVKCLRCMENCPAGAIDRNAESLFINPSKCQSCQRCVGFCPTHAIVVQGKPAEQYRAMGFEEFVKR